MNVSSTIPTPSDSAGGGRPGQMKLSSCRLLSRAEIASKGRMFGVKLDRVFDMQPLPSEKIGDRAFEAGIGKVVRRIGRHRPVAARHFMFPLRPRFDPFQAMPQGKINRLIIAYFEMQERVLLDRSPISAVEGVVANQ